MTVNPKDTFKDPRGSLYAILDSPIDVYPYLYVVNLTQQTVVKMKPDQAERFVEHQDLVPADIGFFEVENK